MANLAIRGHTTRGKEVIEILEMLGGRNKHDYSAVCDILCFYIGKGNNIIYYDWVNSCHEDEDILVFSLEEFLEKFPYKVGDKVSSKYLKNYEIVEMKWEDSYNRVNYKLKGHGWYSPNELQPYKEETMEEKDDKPKAPKLQSQDYSGKRFGYKIPDGYEFDCIDNGEMIIKPKQPQYPKTYEECCKVLNTYCTMPSRPGYKEFLIAKFQELLICRDAYWKIAGDWKPDWEDDEWNDMYYISFDGKNIHKETGYPCCNVILIFPTEEMRDAFLENFKELIEQCKEFL